MRRLHILWDGLFELLLPTRCVDCAAALPPGSSELCGACRSRLPWLARDGCRRCQQAPSSRPGALCVACAADASPLDACVASVAFNSQVESWIHRFKYPVSGPSGLDPGLFALLGELAADAAARAPGPLPDLLVPVALHPHRLRRRGFNPAMWIASRIANSTGVRCAPHALRRLRDTPSQTGLDRRQRRRNVAGAFGCPGDVSLPHCVWLIDDVVTTGSTLSEAARALRRRGARRVVGICLARTLWTR